MNKIFNLISIVLLLASVGVVLDLMIDEYTIYESDQAFKSISSQRKEILEKGEEDIVITILPCGADKPTNTSAKFATQANCNNEISNR